MSEVSITTEYQLFSALQEKYYHFLIKQSLLLPSVSIQEIDNWINKNSEESDINIPLVISGVNGCGKSSLISKWIEYYTNSPHHSQTLIIYHFIGMSPCILSYYFTLYQLSNLIKKTYGFSNALEITKEKIKSYFGLWLERVDIQHQDPESNRKMLVILIDGLEKYTQSTESFDWIPLTTPKSVKIIYTCNRNSQIYKFLKSKRINEVNAEVCDTKNRFALTMFFSKIFHNDFSYRISKEIKKFGAPQNALYLKLLFHSNYQRLESNNMVEILSLENIRTTESLFDYILQRFTENSVDPQKIYMLFACLSVASSGLSIEEQLDLFTDDPIPYIKFFSFLIPKAQSRFFISNSCFKSIILKKYLNSFQDLHSQIANTLCRLSPGRVADISFHIYKSRDSVRLKNYLSQVTIFSEMIKPENKLNLFFYWIELESIKFDPVDCYNKALENFSNISHLSPQDLSILLVIFSVFFKEHAEFEQNAARFKHPQLIGLHELKEIDLIDEFSAIGCISNKKSFPDDTDIVSVENPIARERFKQEILQKLKTKVFKVKQKRFYCYKRWLWIQFPWCSLDVHSNFSEIMKEMQLQPESHWKELMDSIKRIIKNSGSVFNDFTFNKSIENPSITISKSQLPKLKASMRLRASEVSKSFKDPFENISQSFSQSSVNEFKGIKVHEVSCSLSFQGLKPANALIHVQDNFLRFARAKVSSKVKENQNLQRILNGKADEFRIKRAKLEAISSQIDYSNAEFQVQDNSKARVLELQEKLNEMCKRINRTEAESSRYNQIIYSCFKNPAKNDEWERLLNKKIDSMRKIIECERKNIESHEKDLNEIHQQLEEFQKLKRDKLESENKTLDKVLEQFLVKSKINEQIVNRELLRNDIYNSSYYPVDKNFKETLKEQKRVLVELKEFKGFLAQQCNEHKEVMKKLKQIGDIKDSNDLSLIMERINHKEELEKYRLKVEEKLNRLENERNMLALKLEYLKKQEEQCNYMNFNERIDSLFKLQTDTEIKLELFQELSTNQELIFGTCKGALMEMWKKLEIKNEFSFEPENYSAIFGKIAKRIIFLQTGVIDLRDFESKSFRSYSPGVGSTHLSADLY